MHIEVHQRGQKSNSHYQRQKPLNSFYARYSTCLVLQIVPFSLTHIEFLPALALAWGFIKEFVLWCFNGHFLNV